jgi:hypothetical protein
MYVRTSRSSLLDLPALALNSTATTAFDLASVESSWTMCISASKLHTPHVQVRKTDECDLIAWTTGAVGENQSSPGAVDGVLRGSVPVHLLQLVLLPFDCQAAVPSCPVQLHPRRQQIGEMYTTGLYGGVGADLI